MLHSFKIMLHLIIFSVHFFIAKVCISAKPHNPCTRNIIMELEKEKICSFLEQNKQKLHSGCHVLQPSWHLRSNAEVRDDVFSTSSFPLLAFPASQRITQIWKILHNMFYIQCQPSVPREGWRGWDGGEA